MVTLSEPPLPSLGQLARSLVTAAGNGSAWSRVHSPRAAHWYTTGSEALAVAVGAAMAKKSTTQTAWFPGYFCNYALRFIRRMPVRIRFYDVRENLTTNWEQLDQLMGASSESDIFVLVHYFGFPNETDKAADFCVRHSMTLIEDAAHVLIDAPGIGRGTYLIFSPHKLLPAPEGGLLLAAPTELVADPSPRPFSFDLINWAARRLTQRSLNAVHVPWHFLPEYRKPPDFEAPMEGRIASCNTYVRRLLRVMETDLDEVIARRRLHYLRLFSWMENLPGIIPMFEVLREGVCPYVFPIRVAKNVERFIGFLRAKGIPASRWPDLPPEVTSADTFVNTIPFAEQTVVLPVHQTLTLKQIDRAGERLRQAAMIVS